MDQVVLVAFERNSVRTELGGLVVSVPEIRADHADLAVGRPGLPNIERTLRVGGMVLFETPDDGVFEVRLTATRTQDTHPWSKQAVLLISRVSPRLGITGGFVEIDPSNDPFTPDELGRIGRSLDDVRAEMKKSSDETTEQLDLVLRKLDEIQTAASRLGRKDWLGFLVGSLTSLVVKAALAPAASKTLFLAASSALAWLVGGALRLLE